MSAGGLRDGRLADCPRTPNCVCSEAADRTHAIEPFVLDAPPDKAWRAIQEVVGDWPRARIVTRQASYLHAECRTPTLGFTDDLELQLLAEDGVVAVRSASRLGYSDLGANRRRVEALREVLRARGVVR